MANCKIEIIPQQPQMDLNDFCDSRVLMKNVNYVKGTIEKFIKSGINHLQVISDFDMTLTRYKDSYGVQCFSTYSVLEATSHLPLEFKEATKSIKELYYPIEIDPLLTIEQKIPHMIEWWTKAHNLLIECKMNKQWIPKMVENSRIFFRDQCDWLFKKLNQVDVPLLVFSAGLGDIIEETFRQRSTFYPNIKIVSNFMEFDNEGQIVDFKGELLHVFNKNENAIHKSDYFSNLVHRDNVLLMGDSLGDLRMADGAEYTNILKIGFLNSQIEENKQKYMDEYDIVILDDQTMQVPNNIINLICKQNGIIKE